MKHIFVVNPTAGSGKSLKVAQIIDSFCKEKNVSYEIIYTSKPGDATEIIKTLGENNIVYSVGGDGTLKEVVNGIVGTNNILSVIPSGSGNDFQRSLEKLPNGIRDIDLGMVNGQFFINIASIGLDAEIAKNAELMKQKKIPNSMIYNVSIPYTLFNRQDPTVYVNDEERKITLMAICNGSYYGRGFKMAPKAKITDGLFDVYIVDSLKTIQIPGLFLKLLNGNHEDSKFVEKLKCYSLKVESEKEIICSIDGEIIKDTCFDFDLIHNAIKIDAGDPIGIKRYIKAKQK